MSEHDPVTARLLVTGSRNWTDTGRLHLELGRAARELSPTLDLVIVHGAAAGADTDADQWAAIHGIGREPHPADWDGPCQDSCKPGHRRPRPQGGTYCPAAGVHRNQAMVDLGAHLCVAFIYDRSAGATGCANLAQAAGILTRRFHDPWCPQCGIPMRAHWTFCIGCGWRPHTEGAKQGQQHLFT